MNHPQEKFQPHVSSDKPVKEFSIRSVVLGMLLGVVFGVGNAYLGLKIGTTISASIPAAVMSMAILHTFFKRVTILENNIVQTIATVGEGLAAGVIFTVPALFFLGDSPSNNRIFILAFLGGILGILFMIPMRRFIIVKEHGTIPFPEGTACAKILIAGEKKIAHAFSAAWGLLMGALYKLCISGLYLWNESIDFTFKKYEDTKFSIDGTPSLLGVGFIVGSRISAIMFAGGIIGWWVIIPLIKMFGGKSIIYPSTVSILAMSADDIWSNYVRYIGAGAVAIGGVISVIKIMPMIKNTVVVGFKELFAMFKQKESQERTDQDISMSWLILGSLGIIMFLWLYPDLSLNFLTIVLIAILGYFFTAVTSITVGLVGSSSNPVSGMTITTLLITCLIFSALGWTERVFLIAAITMSCVVNVAICLAATTSQDLKAGYILGATPRNQQIAEIIGLILPSLAIGGTLYLLNEAYGFGSPKMPAPQATLMYLIAKGVINHQLPVVLVMIGIVLGLVMELLRIPTLAFAIGLYLPLSLSSSMMLGGVIKWLVQHKLKNRKAEEQGILASSGLVAGDACMGVVLALLTVLNVIPASQNGYLPNIVSLIMFLLLGIALVWISNKHKNDTIEAE
ncbi:MAG: oligopeptide transporter, OPT family [Chlamydiales bacterium]|nr:oligopeptide transporter, OPT family [Chlamydiales bacterium]